MFHRVNFILARKFSMHLFGFKFSSVAQSYPTLCYPMDCSMPGFPSITNSWSLLKLVSIESVMPSNHLILCHPLPLLLPPSNVPSIRVFSSKSLLCIRWPKYWSFSFSISPLLSSIISNSLQPHSRQPTSLLCL